MRIVPETRAERTPPARSFPGQIALPLILILAGALFLMGRIDVVHLGGYWNLWPVALIAVGLEELYLWSTAGAVTAQPQRVRRPRIPGEDR